MPRGVLGDGPGAAEGRNGLIIGSRTSPASRRVAQRVAWRKCGARWGDGRRLRIEGSL